MDAPGGNWARWFGADVALAPPAFTHNRNDPCSRLLQDGGGVQGEDRGHVPAAHRAQAQGAQRAPVRLRRADGHRLPQDVRPGGPLQDQHRAQPHHAGRPLPRARHPHRRAVRDAGLHRRQHWCVSEGRGRGSSRRRLSLLPLTPYTAPPTRPWQATRRWGGTRTTST